MSEYWDLYNADRQPLNRTWPRGERLPEGAYHIVVEIYTVNSAGQILTTLRHPDKPVYPNQWENTGGSLFTGETSRSGAVRELREETGIVAQEDELVLLGTVQGPASFYDIYLLRRDVDIEDLAMQPGETVAAKWRTIDEIDALITQDEFAASLVPRLTAVREKLLGHL